MDIYTRKIDDYIANADFKKEIDDDKKKLEQEITNSLITKDAGILFCSELDQLKRYLDFKEIFPFRNTMELCEYKANSLYEVFKWARDHKYFTYADIEQIKDNIVLYRDRENCNGILVRVYLNGIFSDVFTIVKEKKEILEQTLV